MTDNQTEFVFSAKDDVTPVVNGLITSLGKLNTTLPKSDKELTQFEKSLANAATKAGMLGAAVGKVQAPANTATTAIAKYNKVIDDFNTKNGALRQNSAGRTINQFGKFVSASDIAAVTEARNKVDLLTASQARLAQTADALNRRGLAKDIAALGSASKTASEEVKTLGNVFLDVPPNSVRYALYDVSGSLAVLGAALSAGTVAAVGFAASYERAFADVQRTVNDLNTSQMEGLNKELMELASTIPVSFQELSRIASLGGQLGIAGTGIDEFTSSVAKLATVSDLSVDKAATAFGRFKAILGVPEQEFDNLASSILAVGVNSVATESQIVNITTQIASMAGFAGFTADQVIGLSGALASIGAPPELSRGVVTRLFATMSSAVAEGGVKLSRFAQIAGTTAGKFTKAWGTPQFATIFENFMKGIGREGGNAVNTLHELGITSVRDVPLLMRLAGAADSTGKEFNLLHQTLKDAKTGWEENAELTRQYDLIAGTFIERLKVLGNNFANLAATVGGPLLSALKPALDVLVGFIGFLQDVAATPVGSTLFATAAALAAVSGAALLVGAAGARAVGGIIAMQQATNGLLGSITATRIQLGTLNTQIATAPGLFGKASAAARGLGAAFTTAFGPIGIAITALTVLPGAIEMARKAVADMTNTTQTAREQISSFGDDANAAFVQGLQEFSAGAARFSADIQVPVYAANGTLRSLDKTISELATSGNTQEAVRLYNELADTWTRNGGNIKALNAYMVDSIPALEGATGAVQKTTGGFEELSEAEEASIKKMEELQTTLADSALKFIDTGSLIDQTVQKQTDAAKKLAEQNGASAEESDTAWQKYYDGQSVNLDLYLQGLQKQVDAQNKWKQNLQTLAERGVSEEILADLAKLGPEGTALVQSLVDGSAAQLQKYKDLWKQAGRDSAEAYAVSLVSTQFIIENAMKGMGTASKAQFLNALNQGMPLQQALKQWDRDAAGNPVDIHANTQPAKAEVYDLARWTRQQSMSAVLYVDVAVRSNALAGLTDLNGRPINPGQFATGGYTGAGGKYDPAGIVHRGEFVFPKEDVNRIGLSNLYAMMGSSRNAKSGNGYASGGYVTGGNGVTVVELSPYDRHLLARAGNVNLSIGGRAVARAVDESNVNATNRGA